MEYHKPPLSFAEQVKLLLSRGLIFDESELVQFLSQVNYYKLSGYLYNFRKSATDDNFIDGTSLKIIQERYFFDGKLRLLIFDAIEKIEIAILRSQLVELFATKYGTFCFTKRENFKNKELHPPDFHTELIKFSEETCKGGTTDFIKGYRKKYTKENHLPFWMLVEKMTFGRLSIFFGNMHREDRLALAKKYDQPSKVFSSWLHAITFVRNLCAHHDRLWNRHISIGPRLPKEKNTPGFHNPVRVGNSKMKIFPTLVIIQYLLNYIYQNNDWGIRVKSLIAEYPDLPIEEIGFPRNWMEVPYWPKST